MTAFTKREIKNTFLNILEDMPLSQITVKSLVTKCGINRNSFYYHYQDIPALIEEIVTEDADEIINSYSSIESMQTGLKAILEFASMKRKAILCFGFAIDWLNNGMEDEADAMIDRFCEFHKKLFGQYIVELVQNP